jgi:hypothetical protein
MWRSRYQTGHAVATQGSTISSASAIIFSTDLTELELPDTMKTHFPDPNNLLSFNLTITPDEGELHWCFSLSSSSCVFSDPVLYL